MATCPSCGSELTGLYCDTCGARAPEERKLRRPKGTPRGEAPPQGRRPGRLSPQRIGRTTAAALLALALFGAGMIAGIWIGRSSVGAAGTALQPTSGVDQTVLDGMTPLAQANFFMETGVTLLNQGQRSAAVSEFRKSITAWQTVLEGEPTNLFARTFLGLTYYYAGDTGQAVETLQAVLDQDANYLWAIFNLAWISEMTGREADAVALYQRYIDVADEERQQTLKYAEQPELIDRQLEAAREAVGRLGQEGEGQ